MALVAFVIPVGHSELAHHGPECPGLRQRRIRVLRIPRRARIETWNEDEETEVEDGDEEEWNPDVGEEEGEAGQVGWRTGRVRASRRGRYQHYRYDKGNEKTIRVQGRRYDTYYAPPQLRVMGGSLRGRRLVSPEVYLRPMMGRVREALFSMLRELRALPKDGTILDCFSGSGSVGIEGLSRGLKHASFIDFSKDCVAATERNLEHCGVKDQGKTVCARVEDVFREPRRYGLDSAFDVITVTPPYEEVDYGDLLTLIASSDLVGEGTHLVVEYPIELKTLPPSLMHRLVGMRNRRYGRTVLAIYACQPDVDIYPRPDEFIKPV